MEWEEVRVLIMVGLLKLFNLGCFSVWNCYYVCGMNICRKCLKKLYLEFKHMSQIAFFFFLDVYTLHYTSVSSFLFAQIILEVCAFF